MANPAETKIPEDMFAKYVEGKLPIKLSDGNVLSVMVTPRDKMTIMKLHNSGRPEAVDQIFAHISAMVSRSYPDKPKEQVDALVIMQSEPIMKTLLIYFELLTEREYDDRRARLLGIEPKKYPDTGAVPSTPPE